MIDNAENRFKFSRMLDNVGILQPQWKVLTTLEVRKTEALPILIILCMCPSYWFRCSGLRQVQWLHFELFWSCTEWPWNKTLNLKIVIYGYDRKTGTKDIILIERNSQKRHWEKLKNRCSSMHFPPPGKGFLANVKGNGWWLKRNKIVFCMYNSCNILV